MKLKYVATSLTPAVCPHCGYKLECSTSLQGMRAAKPGGVTICIRCGGLGQFTEAMAIVPFTGELDEEAAALVTKAQRFIKERLS